MRSFFVQIFLSFWITILITFFLGAVVFPNPHHAPPDALQLALKSVTTELARSHIGCGSDVSDKFFVVGGQGAEICGVRLPNGVAELAARVRRSGQQEFSDIGSKWATADVVRGPDEQRYVAVLLSPQPARNWFPHLPPWVLPTSALVTFAFAYLLTNPVRALRKAFRRFAAGDMTVRLPVSRSALRDWGGADVRTLMIDFNEMADRIQALVQAHKTLLRDVSHELRSPLARLNVALELAREDASEGAAALDRAELESSRLNALISELLSLSLMETTQDVPNKIPLSLVDLIDSLMPDLMFEAEARECRVTHRRCDTCPVLGSEDLLRRALENVIRNAIRYSPSGSEVVLETEQNGTKSIVRVCDRGPGVPEGSLGAIFRPFYRVDSARQSSTGGFGVGLAIADRAIQIHGGTIRASNRQGGGLCVELSLPCASDVQNASFKAS